MKRFLVLRGINWEDSHNKYTSTMSYGYEFILSDYIMYDVWTGYTKGYTNKMKVTWSMTC